MLKALIIDDEHLAREELAQLLLQTKVIEIQGEASNAIEGLQKINQLKPDVVFLDIQMPKITGIELLSMLDPETMPMIIFVTAFDQFAIQAFEDNAFDYLLKPIDLCRLNKSVQRLIKIKQQFKSLDYSAITPAQLKQIPCIGHHRIMIINTDDIEYAYSDIRGVHVHTATQDASTQLTLKNIEEKTEMIRCHRQYLINTQAIKEIRLLDHGLAEIITLSHSEIPVSRRFLKPLKENFGIH